MEKKKGAIYQLPKGSIADAWCLATHMRRRRGEAHRGRGNACFSARKESSPPMFKASATLWHKFQLLHSQQTSGVKGTKPETSDPAGIPSTKDHGGERRKRRREKPQQRAARKRKREEEAFSGAALPLLGLGIGAATRFRPAPSWDQRKKRYSPGAGG